MGHRLFPVPSNFPGPGHQVRHSAPAAVKCLSASRPVDMARKITWCLCKKKKNAAETQTTNAVWTGLCSQSGRTRQRQLWMWWGGGPRATRGRDDGLVCCCCDGCWCVFWRRRSRQQRWDGQLSLAWSGVTADHTAAACHTCPWLSIHSSTASFIS